ncbi:glycosyltransferase family 2 protein [Roseivirga misakiensis]|uniref:Glycosyl transferase n=1 Tax=Roseivirga misakiensis TaxID=1563681 RepID=A0A1E5SZL2_9BACT|nr:glycosyltransferase family 2 protein [Roseivirga misakiensis]OEK04545.1 glycosyl transferase [Roseivirga misakiensis]
MEIIFWIAAFLICYHFVGYGLLISFFNSIKKARIALPTLSDDDLPEVTFVVAAYNEEEIIEDKISNTLALSYPKDKLNILFVTDGSTDSANELISNHPEIQLEFKPTRAGKIAAVNRVMSSISTGITIFSDANVMINKDGLRNLVSHFQRNCVGIVSGEKRIFVKDSDNAAGTGEGFYWKYESFLKRNDAEWNTLVGTAGELFAMRTHLYQPIDERTLIEDFVLSMSVAAKGYKVAYEPNAIALETASASVEEEQKRKIRISAGGIQAVLKLAYLLNFFKYGRLTFQYVSHRVLRWTVIPIAILMVLVFNFLLADEHWAYELLLRLQLICYLLAFAGYILRNAEVKLKFLHTPYYFLFMQICVVLGWFKYFSGKQKVTWEKAKRAQMASA